MADFTLVIGNKNYSSWSLRAWLWMKHLQLDFDEILIQLYQQGMEENLSAYFSGGKVPLLIHGDLQVWDSLAILEYLASLHPDKSGTADIPARAVMRSLCAEMHSSFTSLRQELPMNCRRSPHALDISPNCRADIKRIEALWLHAGSYSDRKDQWLFGSFSMADAMYAPVVLRLDRYAVEVSDASRAYIDRLLAHPAMIEWVAAGRAEDRVIGDEERP